MSIDTGSMQLFGAPASPEGAAKGGTSAGLVLLYAPGFEAMRPAYLLASAEVTIGREPTKHGICIPEQAVSRQHARIVYDDGRWILRDLASRNGTLVDGKFVTEVELEHFHEIRVGDAIFKFVAQGAESYAPYRLDGAMVGGAKRRSTKLGELLGGYQIDRIAQELERIAPTDLSVLVLGESGTGKEVVARELHRASGRKGAFQAINCAAIPATLLESELFGYKRGAFSGADRDKPGILRAADGGTLLLDEIGDLPIDAQAKLLRVLETREVFPVGATHGERVDVRVVCATHRDLSRMQLEGRFRGDLFARLNDYRVVLPPLRERKEDLFLLTRHMLMRHGSPEIAVSFPFMTGICHYDWPFNVRELEATIKRAIALSDGLTLDAGQLTETIREEIGSYGKRADDPAPATPGSAPPPPPAAPEKAKKPAPSEQELRALLTLHHGNVAAVGRDLGKERMQVHRWMKRYGLSPEEFRR